MGRTRLSLKRSLLLSTFFAAALLSTAAFAQNNDDESSTPPRPESTTPTQRSTRTTPTQQNSEPPTPESTTPRASPTQETERPPGLGQTSTTATPTTAAAAPTDTDTELPPALSRTQFVIPTYPPPGIPPTNNAPFMNHSTLPDGTVFIAVGAILGAFGVAILAWRGIVACLLHRSVERAAMAQHVDTNKAAAAFPPPPAPFYKFTDRDSSPSLPGGGMGGAGAGARLNRKSYRGPTPSATPSQTNLFFSPTAAPSGASAMANRDSRFLPSGFYASASPMSMGGAQQHGHGNSISLSNLRPASRGHAAATGPSPPDSPNVRAQSRNFSSSSINLNRPPSGRAPSAFLDDLLDDPAHQGQFPTGQPGQMGPGPFGPAQGYGQGHARY